LLSSTSTSSSSSSVSSSSVSSRSRDGRYPLPAVPPAISAQVIAAAVFPESVRINVRPAANNNNNNNNINNINGSGSGGGIGNGNKSFIPLSASERLAYRAVQSVDADASSVTGANTNTNTHANANANANGFGGGRVGTDKGMLVAIDCEFVAVELEETEEKNGVCKVVKPARHTLGRVSVIRGQGPNAGVPLIDDYIHTSEPVVDYLTKFSGLVLGDLDPLVSTHHLTTLKSAYLQLRNMIDSGVIFIGHGLKTDFQIINLVVPQSQIIDTADLFQIDKQRKLSLRFLCKHLLDKNIQQDTHDSIEDAKSALALYQKYLELCNCNQLEQALEQLYITGRMHGFTV
jgi:hypothetical protein